MIVSNVEIIQTGDPNISIIKVEPETLPLEEVNSLLKEIHQDEINYAMEIAKRKYLRSQRQLEQSDNIMYRFIKRMAIACL